MEVTTKQFVAGVFVTLLALAGTYTIAEGDKVYVCEDSGLVGLCFKLSAINSAGFQTRCYYNEAEPTRYKNCNTGWERLEEPVTTTTTTTTTLPGEEQRILIQNKYNKWYVDTVGGVIDLDSSPVWKDEEGTKKCNAVGEVC